MCVLGMRIPNPHGYGRFVLNKEDKLIRIVEEKDATAEEKAINICNSGILLARTNLLFDCLRKITNNNKQNEYYLTDSIEIAREKIEVDTFITDNWKSLIGVNTQEQLANLKQRVEKQTV